MITLKKCRIKNWDGSEITPALQIKDRIRLKLRYLSMVQEEIAQRTLNRRFHDEPQRTINDLIRWCHGAMGMYAGTSSGCLYVESAISKSGSVIEHVIPVSDLVDLYFRKNVPLPLLLFLPVAKISKESNLLLRVRAKTNLNHKFPFRRYAESGFNTQICDHAGNPIDLRNYTLEDHFSLVLRTAANESELFNKEFAEVLDMFNVKELITAYSVSW